MELVFEITHSMYQVASLFPLFLLAGATSWLIEMPPRKWETWKGKYEAME